MDLPRKYAYRTKWWRFVSGVVYFGLGFYFSLIKVIHTDIDQEPRTWLFMLALAALLGWYALMSAVMLARWPFSQHFLELGPDELVLPHGFMLEKRERIPYETIERIYEAYSGNAGFMKALWLQFNGRKLAIMSSRFSDIGGYPEVTEFLYSRVKQHDEKPAANESREYNND